MINYEAFRNELFSQYVISGTLARSSRIPTGRLLDEHGSQDQPWRFDGAGQMLILNMCG